MKLRALLGAYSIDPLDPDPAYEILFWPQIRILRVQFSIVWLQILASVYLASKHWPKWVQWRGRNNIFQGFWLLFKRHRKRFKVDIEPFSGLSKESRSLNLEIRSMLLLLSSMNTWAAQNSAWSAHIIVSEVSCGPWNAQVSTSNWVLRSRYATCQPTFAIQGPHLTSETIMWADHALFWAAHVFIEDTLSYLIEDSL